MPARVVSTLLLAAIGCASPTRVTAGDQPSPDEVISRLQAVGVRVDRSEGQWDVSLGDGVTLDQIGLLNHAPHVKVLRVGRPVSAAELAEIGRVKTIERVILTFDFTKTMLPGLAKLKHIRNLSINNLDRKNHRLADELPQHLTALQDLETLWIGAQISDNALAPVAEMVGLKAIGISSSRFDGHGLKYLTMLPKLRAIDLNCNLRETPFDYKGLCSLRRLERVEISHMRNCDDACEVLSQMESLRAIEINYTENSNFSSSDLSVAGLRKLQRLPHLESMSLGGAVVERAANDLAKFQNLRTLRVTDDVPDATVWELRRRLPDCDIFHFELTVR